MYINTALFTLVGLAAIADAVDEEQWRREGDGTSNLEPSVIGEAPLVPRSMLGTKRRTQKVLSGHVNDETDRTDFSGNVDDQPNRPTNDGQVDESFWDDTITCEIPEVDRMVSTLIYHPETEQKVDTDATFSVDLTVANLFLVDNIMSYDSPQRVDRTTGQVRGHVHVVIQKAAGDSGAFLGHDSVVYSKRVAGRSNAAVNANDEAMVNIQRLSIEVEGGLQEPGRYRVCTIATAENLQRVIMPAVMRGAQDDCIWFTVRDRVPDREVGIASQPNELVSILQSTSLGLVDAYSSAHINLSAAITWAPGLHVHEAALKLLSGLSQTIEANC